MSIIPKKSLGQHFLQSESALAGILKAANIQKDEIILEIGPGTGNLTEALLKTEAKIIAVEKDGRAIDFLKNRFTDHNDLTVIQDDITKFDRTSLQLNENGYAVVANIPYYITGLILQSFLEHSPRPNRMILLVQKEVADRITALDHKESILSISVKAFGEPRSIMKVPRGAFVPPPTVDSTVLAINNISDRRFRQNYIEISQFFGIVRAGFAHKRKVLIKNLENNITAERLKDTWRELSIDTKIRAEDLTLEQWFEITSRS